MKEIIKKIIRYDSLYPTFKRSVFYRTRKKASGYMARYIYGNPSRHFFVIGITGTNGKTTTANILHTILQDTIAPTVMISTAQIKIGHTTILNDKKMSSLDVFDLQSTLAQAYKQGCKIAILETTSIGLDQQRFEGVDFDMAILTNITHDHLDYHGTFENYISAKKKLFELVLTNKKSNKFAVFPKDDPSGRKRFDMMPFDKKISYSVHSSSMLHAEKILETRTGSTFSFTYLGKTYTVNTSLVGAFNIQNILAALGAIVLIGGDIHKAIRAVEHFTGVPGRMETIIEDNIRHVVDFAHSPDALEKTLDFLHRTKGNGRLIVVFGAPGLRDTAKRPEMGKIVDRFADIIIATDDDADTENRYTILSDLISEIHRTPGKGFFVIPERIFAIQCAIDIAQTDDTVMIAGKGHETVHLTNRGKRNRSDVQQVYVSLQRKHGAIEHSHTSH